MQSQNVTDIYEEERTCLREGIENITGMNVEEMDREDQMREILGFQEGKQEVMEVVRGVFWRGCGGCEVQCGRKQETDRGAITF